MRVQRGLRRSVRPRPRTAVPARRTRWRRRCTAPCSRRSRRPGRSPPRAAPRRARSRSSTATATSVPATNCSTSAVSPYAKLPTMAAGRSPADRTTAAPNDEPPRAGLTINGRPRLSHDGVEDRAGPQLAERRVRQGHGRRRGQPGGGHHGLGAGLVEGGPARARARAHVGQPEQLEHVAQGAVLTGGPVQQRDDDGGTVGLEPAQQRGVDVEQPASRCRRRAARRRPGGRTAARRRARATARRRAPRSSRHAPSLSDSCPGLPGSSQVRTTSGRVGGRNIHCSVSQSPMVEPKVDTRSSSSSMTAASRRTPSRIRSGSG